jgi:lipoprotein-anchoring transpeptidase ErfK/SrfK
MPREVLIRVRLPPNRNHPGWMEVEVNGIPRARFSVLGRGSSTVGGTPTGNPTRNPFEYAGDTPTGDYRGADLESTPPGAKNVSSFGPWGRVRLTAVAGDALWAQDVFGRRGLMIHGGDPGRFDGYRPTLGCLRLSNGDMRRLIGLIEEAGNDSIGARCDGVAIRISVRDRR